MIYVDFIDGYIISWLHNALIHVKSVDLCEHGRTDHPKYPLRMS